MQAITGQDGIGLPEGNVGGGLSMAEGIVIHGRQIVVNQRIGVDELKGAGDGQRLGNLSSESLTARTDHHWAQALASTQHGIAHGVQHGLRNIRLVGHMLGESVLNLLTQGL